MDQPVRVFLIDDHPLLLEALAARLSHDPTFQVVGTAANSDDGFRRILDLNPHLVVIDIEIPGRGAFTIAEELLSRLPKTKVVFFTGFLTDVFLDQALRVNCAGYLLKGESPQRLVDDLKLAMRGQDCFSAAVRERLEVNPLTGKFEVKASGYLATLTSRQLEVLRHLARGESVKEVARTMILSERAIESHKYRIMQKLGLHDRVELARYAIREGLTVP